MLPTVMSTAEGEPAVLSQSCSTLVMTDCPMTLMHTPLCTVLTRCSTVRKQHQRHQGLLLTGVTALPAFAAFFLSLSSCLFLPSADSTASSNLSNTSQVASRIGTSLPGCTGNTSARMHLSWVEIRDSKQEDSRLKRQDCMQFCTRVPYQVRYLQVIFSQQCLGRHLQLHQRRRQMLDALQIGYFMGYVTTILTNPHLKILICRKPTISD